MTGEFDERRKYQRVTFARPVAGKLGSSRVFVVDVSISGARIAHQGELPKTQTHKVAFEWQGDTISFDCEVMRTEVDRPNSDPSKVVYQSGVRFVAAYGQSAALLRGLIAEHVMRALDEQKANARGIPPLATVFQSGIKDQSYVTYRYVRNQWVRTETKDSQQPLDGFTVSSKEDPLQIEMLCKTYESSDYSGRKMIRQMAELSISAAESVPTRRYRP